MSPDGYRQLLEHVKATGVNVWVQDGSGVDKLTAEQRERYLQASADCQSSAPASGIVYELFVAGKGRLSTLENKESPVVVKSAINPRPINKIPKPIPQ